MWASRRGQKHTEETKRRISATEKRTKALKNILKDTSNGADLGKRFFAFLTA